MLAATRHTRLICAAETLARETFTEILPFGENWVNRVVTLRNEFQALVRLVSCRYRTLKIDLKNWQDRVRAGDIEFDQAREDDFKGALRILVELSSFLLERHDFCQEGGLILARPSVIRIAVSYRGEAERILTSWKSPEWETTNERVIKLDKEQTRRLREKLGSCK